VQTYTAIFHSHQVLVDDNLVLKNVLSHMRDFGWIHLNTDETSRSNIVTQCGRVMRDNTSGGFCTFSVCPLCGSTLGLGCLKGCD